MKTSYSEKFGRRKFCEVHHRALTAVSPEGWPIPQDFDSPNSHQLHKLCVSVLLLLYPIRLKLSYLLEVTAT